jgi:hypothetical protein
MGEGRDLQVYKVYNVKLVQVLKVASSSLKFLKSINFNLCQSAGRFIPCHEIDNFQKVQGKK